MLCDGQTLFGRGATQTACRHPPYGISRWLGKEFGKSTDERVRQSGDGGASAEKLRMVEESLAGEASVAKIAHHDIHPNLLRLLRGRCAREF